MVKNYSFEDGKKFCLEENYFFEHGKNINLRKGNLFSALEKPPSFSRALKLFSKPNDPWKFT